MAAAATQGTYLTSPVTTLAHIPQVGALATPNGITTGALTPTTATLANGTLKSTSLKHNLLYFEFKCLLLMRIYVIEINSIIYEKMKINLSDVLHFNFGSKEFDTDWL